MANVDSVDITVRARAATARAPHTTIDPIVLAARHRPRPADDRQPRDRTRLDPAVVTVGSIHGGTKHNIIPNEVKLQLTVRTTKDDVRKHVLEAIDRIAKAAREGVPEPRSRSSRRSRRVHARPRSTIRTLTRRMVPLSAEALGARHVHERPMSMGGEDFSAVRPRRRPGFYFLLGTAPPERVEEAKRAGGRPLATTHSDEYFPVPEPTIKTGVLTMTEAVLDLLKQ